MKYRSTPSPVSVMTDSEPALHATGVISPQNPNSIRLNCRQETFTLSACPQIGLDV